MFTATASSFTIQSLSLSNISCPQFLCILLNIPSSTPNLWTKTSAAAAVLVFDFDFGLQLKRTVAIVDSFNKNTQRLKCVV